MSVAHRTSKLHHTTPDKRQLVHAILSCQGDNKRIRRMCAYWLIRYLMGGKGTESPSTEKTKMLILKAFHKGFI
ncbi:hypothetical protein GCM10011501_14180 [Thalassotalea profundi]|uniref:HEAT repeat domain-containing protein n=1 Tax=Thalassotalea profundi TaxID=2036687 RepID=A0ABQ3IMS6_9GAMM|nr:hypothetical protein GCM10011501_14180 [Thalassotalea profundi]